MYILTMHSVNHNVTFSLCNSGFFGLQENFLNLFLIEREYTLRKLERFT